MKFIYSDGGRKKYFRKRNVNDCAARAIAIATGEDYLRVYKELDHVARRDVVGGRTGSARNGVYRSTIDKVLAAKGWKWHPTMHFGSGCQVHMRKRELPGGTVIVRLSRHVACVKNGTLYDTYDSSRGGNRCVYGYWAKS